MAEVGKMPKHFIDCGRTEITKVKSSALNKESCSLDMETAAKKNKFHINDNDKTNRIFRNREFY